MTARPLRVAIVAGEESGDLLGADLVAALRAGGRSVELTGVGGRHLEAHGLKSLFDPADIALMGISAILLDLPRLLRRIGQTARAIVKARPDCIVTIDSPEFSLRVARKIRALDPTIPIVHYVCPSVWAWRPGRAAAIKPYVDQVLCVLPFEPAELARLGGPPGDFVGHRLTRDPHLREARAAQAARAGQGADAPRTLLVLPGSRRGEVSRLSEVFGETIIALAARGHTPRCVVPTLPKVEKLVRDAVARWPIRPEVVIGEDAKWRAFGEADAALAASGTVTLELALAGVPLVSCYRLDNVARMFTFLLKGWSGSLPNLIADTVVVPEFYNEYLRPAILSRHVEAILTGTPMRQWQLDGFAKVRERLETERPAGELAADVVLTTIARKPITGSTA